MKDRKNIIIIVMSIVIILLLGIFVIPKIFKGGDNIIKNVTNKDKVKITSPDGLYKTCLEDMLKGVQTYRNTRLVHLLDKLGLIENFVTCIPKTLDAYSKFNKKPEFFDS